MRQRPCARLGFGAEGALGGEPPHAACGEDDEHGARVVTGPSAARRRAEPPPCRAPTRPGWVQSPLPAQRPRGPVHAPGRWRAPRGDRTRATRVSTWTAGRPELIVISISSDGLGVGAPATRRVTTPGSMPVGHLSRSAATASSSALCVGSSNGSLAIASRSTSLRPGTYRPKTTEPCRTNETRSTPNTRDATLRRHRRTPRRCARAAAIFLRRRPSPRPGRTKLGVRSINHGWRRARRQLCVAVERKRRLGSQGARVGPPIPSFVVTGRRSAVAQRRLRVFDRALDHRTLVVLVLART
jgi:hypothetical protein